MSLLATTLFAQDFFADIFQEIPFPEGRALYLLSTMPHPLWMKPGSLG